MNNLDQQRPTHHLVVGRNRLGRDFFISDIHGHKPKFERALARVGFNLEAGDRLFCVGDLVDRGSDNLQILGKQLHWPGFYSIKGNHELMLLDQFDQQPLNYGIYSYGGMRNTHTLNGGRWFEKCRQPTRERVVQQISQLPLTLEVDTAYGRIGLVHAEVPLGQTDWSAFLHQLGRDGKLVEQAVWGRDVLYAHQAHKPIAAVTGIDAIIHGHTLVCKPVAVANRLYIDTGLETGDLSILSAQAVFQLIHA
ncbi:metallophosphoesterase [Thiomicrospira microaerophila]|uniref:metallophosphoesterase n=1 Tax=Thiomicrospira microaerophila TaxID=406020 RepID=UPI0012FE230B|nr:metallophosphoesterase [Thiomicrospira microaerophila]